MTVVNVTAALTALGGSEPVTSGRITVEYLRGKDGEPATRAVGAAVTLPTPIVIPIVDGSPVAPVDVPPTDGTCYARIWVECRVPRDAGFLELPAVAIPASGPVDITALVAVDPASFEPVTTVVTAWQLAVDQVAAMRTEVEGMTTEASTFAGIAGSEASRASGAAGSASTRAGEALAHRNNARLASEASAASAVAASGSADAAAGSAVAASTARTGAEAAQAGALTARSGAEAAQTGAQTARTGAETARTGSETAKTAAEAARDVALAGQFAGTDLGGSNTSLDTINTPGVFYQSRAAQATLANSYPLAGAKGVLTVTRVLGAFMIQEYATEFARSKYIRTGGNASWTAWRLETTRRINNPAGQPGAEYFDWDDSNSREQAMLPTGTALGTVSLDVVTLPGIYWSIPANATLASGYPQAGASGVLEVLDGGGGTRIQRLTLASTSLPSPVAATLNRGHWERRYSGASWTAWTFYPFQRVDQTAGRAIYTQDDVNNREQLIYGDTGWRDVSGLLSNGANATTFLLRRVGSNVHVAIAGLQLPSSAAGDTIYALPGGFVPFSTYGLLRETVNTGGAFGFNLSSIVRLYGNVGAGANNTTHRFQGVLTAVTDQPWPTSLPGTASGTIPSA